MIEWVIMTMTFIYASIFYLVKVLYFLGISSIQWLLQGLSHQGTFAPTVLCTCKIWQWNLQDEFIEWPNLFMWNYISIVPLLRKLQGSCVNFSNAPRKCNQFIWIMLPCDIVICESIGLICDSPGLICGFVGQYLMPKLFFLSMKNSFIFAFFICHMWKIT